MPDPDQRRYFLGARSSDPKSMKPVFLGAAILAEPAAESSPPLEDGVSQMVKLGKIFTRPPANRALYTERFASTAPLAVAGRIFA